jgi:hypothetical protein
VTGSVTLAGVLAAVAANAFPGKTIKPSGTHTASEGSEGSAGETSTSTGETSESSSGAVTPPEQAPESSEGRESAPVEESGEASPEAPVISGGS